MNIDNSLNRHALRQLVFNDVESRKQLEAILHPAIQQDMESAERKENYNCDIVYVTNSELGFDYLRDNLAYNFDEIRNSCNSEKFLPESEIDFGS